VDIDTITEFRAAPSIACQPDDATGVRITALPMSPGRVYLALHQDSSPTH
jgi:CO/xanthine dehydrogenase Mo-binding subunit